MAYESLYENDPTLILNESFSSQNTVRGTIVGTPTFSNGTMTTSAVGNYINSKYDFSNKNKFTVRIKGTFATNQVMTISQGDSDSNRIVFGSSVAGVLYFILCNSGSSFGSVAVTGGTYDLFFVYDGTATGNTNRAKIYKNGVLQTLSFSGTIPATCPNLTSKNSRIGNSYAGGYITNNATFEQVQIWNRVLGADEIQARINNSIYKNRNPIMNLNKWIKGTGNFLEKYETTGNSIMPLGQKYFECTVAGTIHLPVKQAYGTWEWSMYKGSDGGGCGIVLNQTTNTYPSTNGYITNFSSFELLQLQKNALATPTDLMRTASAYINNFTWYRLRLTRSVVGAFTLYIKGGVFTSWTLISTSGGTGSNPAIDNTFTSFNFLTITTTLTGDRISDIRFYPYIVS